MARDRQMSCLCLTLLRLGLRGALFDLTAQPSKQVEIVAYPTAYRVEVELWVATRRERIVTGEAEASKVDLLLIDPRVGIDLRQTSAGDGAQLVACSGQRRIACRQAPVVGHGALHQSIEFRRSEGGPPAQGRAVAEIRDWCAGRLPLPFGGRQIGQSARRCRAGKVGANGTASQRRRRDKERNQAHWISPCEWSGPQPHRREGRASGAGGE